MHRLVRRFVLAALLLSGTALSAAAQSAIPADVMKDLAPTGKLRAAINFGNGVLAQKGPNGEARGITTDPFGEGDVSLSERREASEVDQQVGEALAGEEGP